MTGKLVTIEGLDGSGKTTTLESIQRSHTDMVTTREPTTWSKYGQIIRNSLSNEDTSTAEELFLFLADHNEHLNELIRPAIEGGNTVVSDRYIDSRCAYQAQSVDELTHQKAVEIIYMMHKGWSVVPDTTIYLDISVEEAMERLDTDHRHETKKSLQRVKKNYEYLIERHKERFTVVDAEREPQTVHNEVHSVIDNCL